jgi:hypothetical protein
MALFFSFSLSSPAWGLETVSDYGEEAPLLA